jgi:hypothetical protein
MKTESAIRQPKYILEPLEFGRVRVTLYANETPVEREDGTHFIYDKYSADTTDRPALGQYISGNLDAWIAAYSEAEVELVASAARRARDALLAETDWTQVSDVPSTEAERQAWLLYRQALRDVPQQEGFPYTVMWPDKP